MNFGIRVRDLGGNLALLQRSLAGVCRSPHFLICKMRVIYHVRALLGFKHIYKSTQYLEGWGVVNLQQVKVKLEIEN